MSQSLAKITIDSLQNIFLILENRHYIPLWHHISPQSPRPQGLTNWYMNGKITNSQIRLVNIQLPLTKSLSLTEIRPSGDSFVLAFWASIFFFRVSIIATTVSLESKTTLLNCSQKPTFMIYHYGHKLIR